MEPHRKMAAWATCVLASVWACTDARAPEPTPRPHVEIAAEAEPADVATATATATPRSAEEVNEGLAELMDSPSGSAYGAGPAVGRGYGGGGEGDVDDGLAGLRAASPATRRARPAAATTIAPSMASAPSPLGSDPYATTPRARPAAPAALPQHGVLASTFVGGGGVRARLDDLMDRGVMVGGQNVRLEAFAEREPLPYPRPAAEGMAMFAELERERLSTDTDRVHLQIALVGREGELPRRPRMDVRLVLDRSGSMHGDKWSHAIAAAHAIVDDLAPADTFTLVSYSDDATVDFGPARRGDGARAHAAIAALEPGGGTNISAALERVAQNAADREAMGVVLLVSDGQATVGQTSPRELGAIARRHFDATGTLTTAIGLGTDFDEQTMLAIAREGSGSYHFVRRPEDVRTILEDELRARVQAVAQALRVRVELGEGVVARKVYGSRLLSEDEHAAVRATEVATDRRIARELGIVADRQREEERGLRVHLPTFRRGDQHVILMELEVPAGTRAAEIATVTLDYKDLVRRQNDRVVREVRAERVETERAHASVVRGVKRTVLAFQAGEALQRAAEALELGDADGARRAIAERRELLEAASRVWRDPGLAADASLLARYERVLGGGLVDHGSRQMLAMAMGYYGDRRMR
jgi:Ca-activated chloride channel family protein